MKKDQKSVTLHNDQIEDAIRELEQNNTEKNIYELIRLLRDESELGGMFFVPVIDAEDCETPPEDLFDVEKLSLDHVFDQQDEKQAIPRKVELYKGGHAYTAFTSEEELNKGEPTQYTSMPILKFLEMAYEDNTCAGVVLNPWDISVLLDQRVLNLILYGVPKEEEGSHIYIDRGDITRLKVDAIVNAANTGLMAGGGVCGAIFAAAGPELHSACEKLGGCEVGQAKITPGFNLPARYIIHTPGPVYSGGMEDGKLLADSYRNSLDLARSRNLHSIAFPSISTGIYGYPLDEAVPVALNTVSKWIEENADYEMEIIMVCYDQPTYEAYTAYVEKQS